MCNLWTGEKKKHHIESRCSLLGILVAASVHFCPCSPCSPRSKASPSRSQQSGSPYGAAGDWHPLLCGGGNLQSREGKIPGCVDCVDVCAVCHVHSPGPNVAHFVQALVTAKFAGLSMPTKKFDPQKDGWCAEMSSSKATAFFCIVFII